MSSLINDQVNTYYSDNEIPLHTILRSLRIANIDENAEI